MEIKKYVDEIVNVFKEEINDNLIGVYLHGSLAMNCFNRKTSDIDILVIVKEELEIDCKKRIIKKLLALTMDKQNQLEMSIILERYIHDFVYPTPFELHYFHPNYLVDENYLCGGEGWTDPDLVGHIVVTYHRGITLYGVEREKLFKPIERTYYVASIYNDVKDARQQILENPVYFTLNLCRVLYFLKEGAVASKREGGEWGIASLPDVYKGLVRNYLSIYNGEGEVVTVPNEQLISFAGWIIGEIEKLR